jgi:uncharacterized protein YwqG
LISRFGLANFESEIVSQAEECIYAIATRTELENLRPGESRVGGVPDLPNGATWPSCDGEPLSFLAQFDLTAITVYDSQKRLPSTGYLYFFYDAEQAPWGYDPRHAGHWKVLYFDATERELTRYPLPAELGKKVRFASCKLELFKQLTLPDSLRLAPENKGHPQLDDDAYAELMEELGSSRTHHQLLGYSGNIQGAMELECQLVTNGVYRGHSVHGDPRVAALREGARDWTLLFQVDSDDEAKMMWGDLGCLYFWIKRQDLAAKNFEKTWCILQCH